MDCQERIFSSTNAACSNLPKITNLRRSFSAQNLQRRVGLQTICPPSRIVAWWKTISAIWSSLAGAHSSSRPNNFAWAGLFWLAERSDRRWPFDCIDEDLEEDQLVLIGDSEGADRLFPELAGVILEHRADNPRCFVASRVGSDEVDANFVENVLAAF